MSNDALDDRRRALEEDFFKKQNEQLLKKLQTSQSRATSKADIARLTGIANDAVLTALANLNLGSAATLVMSMLPLVEVAWADGSVDAKERQVLLEQAAMLGLKPGSEAAVFLTRWLDEKPDANWSTLWADYVHELVKKLSKDDAALLKGEVLGRARLVAEASGGVLGLGFAVSAPEKKVLERLEKSFA